MLSLKLVNPHQTSSGSLGAPELLIRGLQGFHFTCTGNHSAVAAAERNICPQREWHPRHDRQHGQGRGRAGR